MLQTKKSMPKIIVIGGGATGCGVARDLLLRGYQTILVESGSLGSGTSSRSHGMLQSGARYAVTETSFAAECYRERNIICKIFPKGILIDFFSLLASTVPTSPTTPRQLAFSITD